MAMALSMDLRRRVLAAIGGGMSCRQAAAHFGVSASSAIRPAERLRKFRDRPGRLTPRSVRTHNIRPFPKIIAGANHGRRSSHS